MSKHAFHGSKHQESDASRPAPGGTEQIDPQNAREVPAGNADGQDNTAVPEHSAEAAGNSAETASETAAAADNEGLAEQVATLEAELAEAKDQFLRKAADFENFRKRMNQEKQNAIDFANQSLLLDLIPIIDDFDRAIQSAKSAIDGSLAAEGNAAGNAPSNEFNALYEGIGMISRRLSAQLDSKWGLKSFNSVGEPFDPNRHEALMMEKSTEITEPVVQDEFLKGYILKDRIVRSAKVKVLMPDTSPESEKNEGSDFPS